MTSKVAVIGSGISAAVCASILAKNGISVTIFESARGPGGRMSQRREHCEDGRELLFDHGAPCFAVNTSNLEMQSLVNNWESRGLVSQWEEKFGSFDCSSRRFVSVEEIFHGISSKVTISIKITTGLWKTCFAAWLIMMC
ncbi:hypothetical protein C2S51_036834 [Perilla frutescens var. frutescens]|nr:hypothetical protein C2S51_036834 [Perilla frutescens var. frutescens]